jgi:hypothetical protein
MRRWQELARLAMAIATKEENVRRGIETNTAELPAVPNTTSDIQNPDNKRQGISVEVRDLL